MLSKRNVLRMSSVCTFGLGLLLGCSHTLAAYPLGGGAFSCDTYPSLCDDQKSDHCFIEYGSREPIPAAPIGRRRDQNTDSVAWSPLAWHCWIGY